MANVYTSFYEIKVDLGLYLAIKSGDAITLDLLPAITRDRYFWLVDNWLSLYPRFKDYANGDQNLELALLDFERSVQSTNLGNTSNVLGSAEKINLYSPFFSLITTTQIKPTKDEQDYIRREIARVNAFDISTFRKMITYLKDNHNLTCQFIGLSDDLISKIRGTPIAPKKRTATVDDLVVLEQALELERFIEGIIVDMKNKSMKPPNLLKIANQNIAEGSGFSINEAYKSYVAVPFEKSLTEMAHRYLGDSRRYFELVTVNNLKPPFVDMYGEKHDLVSSGSGNSISIRDTRKDWLILGTKISIGSIKQREEPRLIEKINDNKDGTLTVFLSGEKDLSKLKTEEKAFVRIYQPNTVNEKSMIYVPLDITSPIPSVPTPSSDELRRLDKQLLAFGVDIQRDEKTGDVVFDSSGDFAKCYGVANVRQTVKSIIQTVQGENKWHQRYGLKSDVGNEWRGQYDEAAIIATSIQQAILSDTRFRSCAVTKLNVEGNGMVLGLLVVLKDSSVPIPISFVE